MSTTSGDRRSATSTASRAVGGLAEHLEVASPSKMPLRPSRTTGWSSAMSSRIGLTAHAGTLTEIAVPPPGSDSMASVAVDEADALAHAEQPEAAVVVPLGVRPVHGEADAVVPHSRLTTSSM